MLTVVNFGLSEGWLGRYIRDVRKIFHFRVSLEFLSLPFVLCSMVNNESEYRCEVHHRVFLQSRI